jgi:hypothetical protein
MITMLTIASVSDGQDQMTKASCSSLKVRLDIILYLISDHNTF